MIIDILSINKIPLLKYELLYFQSCLKRSFEAKVYQCPTCRTDLGKDCPMKVNANLAQALTILFPGYSADRQ